MKIFKLLAYLFFLYPVSLISTGTLNMGSLTTLALSCLVLMLFYIKNKSLKIIISIFLSIYTIALFTFIILIYKHINYYDEKQLNEAEYILVLGSKINKNGEPNKNSQQRLNKTIEFSNKYPNKKIFLTGGQGLDEPIAESVGFKYYLLEHNVKADIDLETTSSSTSENFINFKKKIKKDHPKVILITNNFHISRAMYLAKKNGIDAYPVAAKSNLYTLPCNIIREQQAYIKSFLFD